jgi:hypothetical protein
MSSDMTKLFQAINQTFNDVTLTIELLVESACVMFLPAMRNGATNISVM